MTEGLTIKSDALEPLFEAWEEPSRHRVLIFGIAQVLNQIGRRKETLKAAAAGGCSPSGKVTRPGVE